MHDHLVERGSRKARRFRPEPHRQTASATTLRSRFLAHERWCSSAPSWRGLEMATRRKLPTFLTAPAKTSRASPRSTATKVGGAAARCRTGLRRVSVLSSPSGLCSQLDHELLPALHGRPGRIRHDRHTAGRVEVARQWRNRKNGANSGNGSCVCRVEALELAAKERTARDDSEEHAGNANVDAEDGAAIHFAGHVGARQGFADVAKILWRPSERFRLDLIRGSSEATSTSSP